MKKIAAAALAGLVMASTPAVAADLFGTAAPPMSVPQNPTVEIGSNWYIRGDVGLSLDNTPSLSISSISLPTTVNGQNDAPAGDSSNPVSIPFGRNQFSKGFTADLGLGYRVNNYLRLEATYDYRSGPGGASSNNVVCPYNAVGASNSYYDYSTTPPTLIQTVEEGYVYNPSNTCDGILKVNQNNNMGLVSAYLDLGTYWGITPYVGAGGGLNVNTMSGNVTYYTNSNGQAYNADLTATGTYPQVWVTQINPTPAAVSAGPASSYVVPLTTQPKVSFAPQNWNRDISSTKYSAAWALMAGIGIQISPSATLDLGYRYLNTGVVNTLVNASTGTVLKQTNTSQQFRIGIRYMVN